MAKFIESKGLNERPLKLCFTFAFPCNQKGINEAYLVRWTRNFNIPDAVGRDIAKLLQESLDKKASHMQFSLFHLTAISFSSTPNNILILCGFRV